MHTSYTIALKTVGEAADTAISLQDVELTLATPVELDAESLRHVGGGGGGGDVDTPVVSW